MNFEIIVIPGYIQSLFLIIVVLKLCYFSNIFLIYAFLAKTFIKLH
jgi:hypothetical protein